jgi:hypothetical protein
VPIPVDILAGFLGDIEPDIASETFDLSSIGKTCAALPAAFRLFLPH